MGARDRGPVLGSKRPQKRIAEFWIDVCHVVSEVRLEVFREMPQGKPRYVDKLGLSATLNKFLRENGLMPSGEHTVYGLRHSFEDRLLIAGVDERVRRDLMGHRLDREKYGDGGGLKLRHKAIVSIAL